MLQGTGFTIIKFTYSVRNNALVYAVAVDWNGGTQEQQVNTSLQINNPPESRLQRYSCNITGNSFPPHQPSGQVFHL